MKEVCFGARPYFGVVGLGVKENFCSPWAQTCRAGQTHCHQQFPTPAGNSVPTFTIPHQRPSLEARPILAPCPLPPEPRMEPQKSAWKLSSWETWDWPVLMVTGPQGPCVQPGLVTITISRGFQPQRVCGPLGGYSFIDKDTWRYT